MYLDLHMSVAHLKHTTTIKHIRRTYKCKKCINHNANTPLIIIILILVFTRLSTSLRHICLWVHIEYVSGNERNKFIQWQVHSLRLPTCADILILNEQSYTYASASKSVTRNIVLVMVLCYNLVVTLTGLTPTLSILLGSIFNRGCGFNDFGEQDRFSVVYVCHLVMESSVEGWRHIVAYDIYWWKVW